MSIDKTLGQTRANVESEEARRLHEAADQATARRINLKACEQCLRETVEPFVDEIVHKAIEKGFTAKKDVRWDALSTSTPPESILVCVTLELEATQIGGRRTACIMFVGSHEEAAITIHRYHGGVSNDAKVVLSDCTKDFVLGKLAGFLAESLGVLPDDLVIRDRLEE